jgi:uncharacterized protein involved in exopolysaccharide biosynthesis
VARDLEVWASVSGTNLVRINARATDPQEAARIANSVIDEYLLRATEEAARNAAIAETYYTEQLALARVELEQRRASLSEYLVANPQAAIPGTIASQDLDYRTLVGRVESQQAIVDQLQAAQDSTQRELASAPESQAAAFTLQDPAQVPGVPLPTSAASRFGIPLAGVLAGVTLAAAYILVRYRTDHTIRSTEDLQDSNVRVLGTVQDLAPRGALSHIPVAAALDRARHREFARQVAVSIPQPEEL